MPAIGARCRSCFSTPTGARRSSPSGASAASGLRDKLSYSARVPHRSVTEPRIRVSAILRRGDKVLLIRHEKGMREVWLLPGGGVHAGESLVDALHRELREELGIDDEPSLEGPVAIVDSISPVRSFAAKHVVHIIFAADLGARSLETVTSKDAA